MGEVTSCRSRVDLLLRGPRRERHACRHLAIQHDLEPILAGAWQGNVEDEHGAGLYVHDPGGRLAELHRAFAAEELVAGIIHEADPDGVHPDLGAPASDSEHKMGAGTDRRKIAQPHVLEDAQDAELALLVDQGVVRDEGKVEMQLRKLGWS